MILCNNCCPCCDFCKHVIHETWEDGRGNIHNGGPIACGLHNDEEHNNIAEGCGYCDDFYCFRVKEEAE